MSTVERSGIFIAYHYPEKRWLDRVQAALKSLPGADRAVVWDDRKVVGNTWRTELTETLARTKVVILIVSDPFLQSGFVTRAKLPAMLDRERADGLRICWVLAGYCLFSVAGLRADEAGNGINAALDGLNGTGRDAAVAEVARKVALLLGVTPEGPAAAPAAPAVEPALPSPISLAPTDPQESKAAPKKRKRPTAAKDAAPDELPLDLLPVTDSTEDPPQPLPSPPPPQPQLQFPAPKPQTHLVLPPLDPPVAATPIVEAPTPSVERPALRAESPMLPALDGVIETRMATIVELRRVARWLKFTALGVLLLSLPVVFGAGRVHFLLIFGFAVFLGALAIFFHARIDLLGQHLVGLRYARSGLADELLPTRQREPLLRKAAEVLGG